jgi:tetrahydromethanopterin S-methyltransferase subunit F
MMAERSEQPPCERLIRLEAHMEAWENWRREFLPRFEAIETLVNDLKTSTTKQFGEVKLASSRQYNRVMGLLFIGFIGLACGLLYIILNHGLLP